MPKVSSERRGFLPCGICNEETVISDLARVIYGASVWNLALIGARLHLVWIATVCGKLKTDFSLLQYARVEHLPRTLFNQEKQS